MVLELDDVMMTTGGFESTRATLEPSNRPSSKLFPRPFCPCLPCVQYHVEIVSVSLYLMTAAAFTYRKALS